MALTLIFSAAIVILIISVANMDLFMIFNFCCLVSDVSIVITTVRLFSLLTHLTPGSLTPSQYDINSHLADMTGPRPVPAHLTRDLVSAMSSSVASVVTMLAVGSGAGHDRQQQLWPVLRLLEQGDNATFWDQIRVSRS